MKQIIYAEIVERRGRVMRVKYSDGVIGSLPAVDLPPGTKLEIKVESSGPLCKFDTAKIWPSYDK